MFLSAFAANAASEGNKKFVVDLLIGLKMENLSKLEKANA